MRAFFALIVMLAASCAQADERFLPHVKWIADNSPLEYNGEPLPRLEYVPQEMLQIMGYGDQTVAQAEYEGRALPQVLAVYNEYVIYAASERTFTDKPWVLVHELVHYLQDVNGTTKPCVPANEPQAYRLHDKWQAENGYEEQRNSANVFYGMLLGLACQEHHSYGSR